MGLDLSFSYSLERPTPLSAEELDTLAQHLRKWRGEIYGYDWRVPSDPSVATEGLIAYGEVWPTDDDRSVDIDNLHEALAEVRNLVHSARLAFSDNFSAYEWSNGFIHREDAPYARTPNRDEAAWVWLGKARGIPTALLPELKRPKPRRAPRVPRDDAMAALASADRAKLLEIVLAPLDARITDRRRTAAVELLGKDPAPEVLAALVERTRRDGHERPWTHAVLRVLAAEPRRCPWATALLATDRMWPGSEALLVAAVTEDAIPHLVRAPSTPRWDALVVHALDAIDSDASRTANRARIETVFGASTRARLEIIMSVLTVQRALRACGGWTGNGDAGRVLDAYPTLCAALQGVASALAAYGTEDAAAQALAEPISQVAIERELAALAAYPVGHESPRLSNDQRVELWNLEAAWLAQHGFA
jgi:hypothetical protein